MRRLLTILPVLFLVLCGAVPAQAQETGHYIPGMMPNQALGALPPFPGVYYSQIFGAYRSDIFNNKDGHAVGGRDGHFGTVTVQPSLSAGLTVPTFVGVTDVKILGGNYGASLYVPYTTATPSVAVNLFDRFGRTVDQTNYGIGDVGIAPFQLGWHGDGKAAWVGYTLWVPTGRYADGSVENIGLGYFSHDLQAGGAICLDKERTWTLSALGTYEIHGRHSDIDITPGQSFNVEYGLSKKVCPNVSLGLSGYGHWQTTGDAGTAVHYDTGVRESCQAFGGEISWTIPEANHLNITLRHLRQFGAVQTFQGNWTFLVVSIPITMDLPPHPAPAAEGSEAPPKAPEAEQAPGAEQAPEAGAPGQGTP